MSDLSLVDKPFFKNNFVFNTEQKELLRPLYVASLKGSPSVFNSPRLSSEPIKYSFGALRKILGATPIKAIDLMLGHVYRQWLHDINTPEAYTIGEESASIPNEILVALCDHGDPAIFTIHALENIRRANYPDLYREPRRVEILHRSFDLILSSIHGPAIMNMDCNKRVS